MKKRLKSIFALLLIFSIMTSLLSCDLLPDEGEYVPEQKDPTVMVYCDEGATVDGESMVTVKEGESASFKINFDATVLDSVEVVSGDGVAVFDEESSTLTVSGATRNTAVNIYTTEISYDVTVELKYLFRGSKGDVSKPGSSSSILAGTLVTLTAGDNERVFKGWSLGGTLSAGGTLLSESRSYQVRLSPDMVKNGMITIYSNYTDANKLIYDANGGSIGTAQTTNLAGNDYYTAARSGDILTVTYTKQYLEFFECGCSFFDDGSFKREGYILKEYNTAPDGSGDGYSLGSKVPLVGDSGSTVLYCIWSEESSASDFLYEDISIPYAFGANATRAPHWSESGVKITAYLGNAETVTVPEKIDGKYVTAIGAGAFENVPMTTLVMGGRILKIEDGAFVNCSSLSTLYCPDTLAYVGNAAMDAITTQSLKKLCLNACMAPRYGGASDAGLSVKLSRLLASEDMDRVIVVAGSSTYQGLASRYLEDLLDGKYRVVNFGTTRTTNGGMYLEAMQDLAHEGDIVVYAPENSSYMMGERELYWKTLRDLEHMYNIYRHVDISNYTNVFGALCSYNTDSQRGRYKMNPTAYEKVVSRSDQINKYGDYQNPSRAGYQGTVEYIDTYFITMNERIKSRFDLDWNSKDQANHADYNDPTDNTWCSFTDAYYKDEMNRVITAAKSSGATVVFGFCPVDGSRLVAEAKNDAWLAAYDRLIKDTYLFDASLGRAKSYVYDHKYFYDCAFHLNDFGRTYRTYQVYTDLCALIGVSVNKSITDLGTAYQGCSFETGAVAAPLTPWAPSKD